MAQDNQAVNYDTVVSDNGSGYIKIGFGGDNFPRFVIPSIIGRPMLRANQKVGEIELKEEMFGDEAAPLRSMLEISYPLQNGRINNWDDMEKLWNYSFNKLGLPEDKSGKRILLTEPANNSKDNRIKMAKIMFEKFGFGSVVFETQALLTLMSQGNTTGLVMDSGDGVTHCIPVFENMVLKQGIKRLNLAGHHVTNHLVKLLQIRGYNFNSSADFEMVREIKEDMCYTSINMAKESKMAQDTTVLDKEYKLPNGDVIIVGRERFMATEILLQPHLYNKEMEDHGMAEMVYDSICSCDMDVQKKLASNIWLSGGTTMIPGLSSRIEHDIKETYVTKKGKGDRAILNRVKVQVHDPPSRKNAVFMGGSFFSKVAQESHYISNAEYKESGEKCLFRN